MAAAQNLADLRRSHTTGHQDLREWRLRDEWLSDNTAAALAWAGEHGCVIHEALCSHVPQETHTLAGTMAEVKELFAIEHPKGTRRYFGFCGHCLVERIPNFGWKPTPHDIALRDNLAQRLRDMYLLGEQPISRVEMVKRMTRYGSADLSRAEFKRLLDYYRAARGDEEGDDLSHLIVES